MPAATAPSFRSLSYCHRGSSQPLIGATIDQLLRGVIAAHPDREAVVALPQRVRLTYAQLDREVDLLARGLVALDLGRGRRVGVQATDNVEWILLQLAAARTGAMLVNINPACRTEELRHALTKARVQGLFVIPEFESSRYVDMALELCPEARDADPDQLRCAAVPELRRLVVWDPADPEQTTRPARGFLTWQEVLARGADVPAARIAELAAGLDPDDPVNIQFTSGTTGAPKAVVLTHHNLVNNAWFTAESLGLGPDDRLCVPVPFYHCFGMVVSTLATLSHGACVVIPSPHFDAAATLAAIESERCTLVHGVPTMFVAQLESPDFGARDLSSLRTGIMAGAPCPPDLVRRVIEEMGCEEILIGYGQTESSPVSHMTRRDDPLPRRIGTVGINLPHVEVKVIDPETGALLPRGRQGEICLRGYLVMRGYFEDEAATQRAVDAGGWLHSGDLGVLDEEDYLSITGRLKDMIIRGGENIYPAEVEACYFAHPAVAEVAVFGVADERMGEEVGAFFQLHDGALVTVEELRQWAKGRMAHFKIPRYAWIVDAFPMTVTGKIQKFRMRELAAQWLAANGLTGNGLTGNGAAPNAAAEPAQEAVR